MANIAAAEVMPLDGELSKLSATFELQAQEMPFQPRYGEPNWLSRPYEDQQGLHCLTPENNNSYEENRLLRESHFTVPWPEDTA